MLRGLAKSSHEVSNVEWMALVRQCGRDFWLSILKGVPWLGGEAGVVWVVSLHKFNEVLCEVGCGGMLCMLGVEPMISFG